MPEVPLFVSCYCKESGLPHQCAHWFAMTCRRGQGVCGCKDVICNNMQRGARCLRVQGRPPSVIARSEATWQSASPAAAQAKRNYSRRIRRSCGFALGIANLLGFPAGLRIATPVCALVRNDMQKGGKVSAFARLWFAMTCRRGQGVCVCKAVVRNDMQRGARCLRVQGRDLQ